MILAYFRTYLLYDSTIWTAHDKFFYNQMNDKMQKYVHYVIDDLQHLDNVINLYHIM